MPERAAKRRRRGRSRGGRRGSAPRAASPRGSSTPGGLPLGSVRRRAFWNRYRAWFLVLFLGFAAAGHAWFWYLPRPRPGLPGNQGLDGDDLPARLLEHPELPLAAWIPYPHQNLGALKGRGLDPEALEAALTLADLGSPSLPRFGPLAVPPSSSLGVATDRRGERFVIAARVYPAVAAFARLGGLLAGNPWLAGGEVRRDDQTLWVRWHGSTWTVGSERDSAFLGEVRGGEDPADPGSRAYPGRPAVLVATAQVARPPLPNGRYYLYVDGRGMELVSDRALRSPPSRARDMARTGTLLLAVAGSDGPLGRGGQAMALIGQEPGKIAELPRGAVLHRPGIDRWDLPAEGLLSLSGQELPAGQAAGLELVATDGDGLKSAIDLAPGVALLLPAGDAPAFGLWLELAPASAEIHRLRTGLERAPLWSRRQLRRWQAADRFLAGLARSWSRLELDVRDAPPALWFRVESAPAAEDGEPDRSDPSPAANR